MAAEDYQIHGTNFSNIAKNAKQFYGNCNLSKSQQLLNESDIEYQIITQGIRFVFQNEKYVYWSKKNRVYKGTKDTGLTMTGFVKQYVK
jgi:hypothetical protein